MTRVSFAVAALVFLCGITARADGWGTSFASAESYLAAVGPRAPAVLVAGAGKTPSPTLAVNALRAALAKTARLVMDADAIGAITDLGDAGIVKRAAGLPVDAIVIVRLFAGDGGHDTAVVTFYDKKAQPLTAFSVAAGTPVGIYAPAQGSGVSVEASDAISSVLKNRGAPESTPDLRTPAQREYDDNFIGFYEKTVARTDREMRNNSCPYQGVARASLCGASFFELVGHRDLYAATSSRSSLRTGLIASGSVLLVAGAITAVVGGLAGKHRCVEQNDSFHCTDTQQEASYPIVGVGAGLAAVGLVGVIAGAVIRPKRVSPAQIYELAREHNQKLRRRLGMPDVADVNIPVN